MTQDRLGAGTRLWPAPNLDTFPIGADLVLRTDSVTLRLDGGVAAVVRDRILPALADGPDRDMLRARLAGLPGEELMRVLEHLVASGVVVEGDEPSRDWFPLVAASGAERAAIAARASQARVVVIGLDPAGVAVAEALGAARLGTVILADPYPLDREQAISLGQAGAAGTPRQEIVARALSQRWPQTRFDPGPAELDRPAVEGLIGDGDLAVTVVDRRLSAIRHWVNSAAMERGYPTLHVDVRGHRAEIGPLVLPGAGPCFLCWRMRAIACEDDFEMAMAREEAFDHTRMPPPHARPIFPTLPPWIGAVVGHEAIAVALGVAQPRLAGKVLALDAIELTEGVHTVLSRPDCPACSKKDRPPQGDRRSLAELCAEPRRETNFPAIAATVSSPLCGLVRALERIPKDVEEPEHPVIVRAELANAQFLPGEQGFVGCSGKGHDVDRARNLALGEALERYSALTWIPRRKVSAARHELDGPALDPRDLVLFAEHQYAELPYTPYDDGTVLEWVPAQSVTRESEVWVPLLAAHIGYPVPSHDAYLFPTTSNGFAAGPTMREALLAALLEVVERDAFLIAWANRLPGARYRGTEVPDEEAAAIAKAYLRRGVSIDVHELPTDSEVTVALAVGWSPVEPAVVIGLGADPDLVTAARRAILEVGQIRPSLRARLRRPEIRDRLAALVADPAQVSTLEDHDLLYADPDTAAAQLGFLRDAPARDWPTPPARPAAPDDQLRRVVDSLVEIAGDVLYLDTTPDDVADLGVRVAKAIVPGFQPIHFGARETRLGGARLRELPWRMGLRDRAATLAELNHAPHPMA